jgi:hypothetical protein
MLASLQKKPSRFLPRLSTDHLTGLGVICLVAAFGVIGIIGGRDSATRFISFLLLPLVFTLPSLWVFSWLRRKQPDRLTWRYGLIVFTGSGFLSLISLLFWQGFSYFVLLPLRPGFAELFLVDLNLFSGLNYPPKLIYFLVGVSLITEFVKPLPALLLWPHLSRREAFLVGALAGAGFAPLAATLYWILASEAQFTISILTFTGAAIQIFSSGLVTLGWYQLAEEGRGWPRWLAYYGMAAALQLLWNLGFLMMVGFTGLPRGVDWLGGWLLLLSLGLLTLWGGSLITNQPEQASEVERTLPSISEIDRLLAVWGAACFLAIVPIGLIVVLILQ